MPDIVANLRVDQAWGSAQIMGALHQVNALYYNGTTGGQASRACGHPDDKLGFAVGGGIKLNAPMIGAGDFFQTQVNYTQGALRYIFKTPNTNWGKDDGLPLAVDVVSRCRLRRQAPQCWQSITDTELTTAWASTRPTSTSGARVGGRHCTAAMRS